MVTKSHLPSRAASCWAGSPPPGGLLSGALPRRPADPSAGDRVRVRRLEESSSVLPDWPGSREGPAVGSHRTSCLGRPLPSMPDLSELVSISILHIREVKYREVKCLAKVTAGSERRI